MDPRPSPPGDALVFTLALGGYSKLFSRCLRSQQAYCERHGYRYAAITSLGRRVAPDEAAWLKVPMVRAALDAGYPYVVFLDADCEVRPHAPPIASIGDPDDDGRGRIYMAPGFSGRFNAGVIAVRNGMAVGDFFQRVLDHAEQEVPPEDQAPWENGHMIHFARRSDLAVMADEAWNNNAHWDDDAYIQHYSGDSLRSRYYASSASARAWRDALKLRKRLSRLAERVGLGGGRPAGALRTRLDALAAEARDRYRPFDAGQTR